MSPAQPPDRPVADRENSGRDREIPGPDREIPGPDREIPGPDREILSAADVSRTVARIAHQLIEKTALDSVGAPRVVLLGIPTRGAVLAERIADRVAEFAGTRPDTGLLDTTLYRDDLRRRPPRALEPTVVPTGGVEDAVVVLVDDVLFSGRTVRAALDALRDLGRPRSVQLAVLVDRGHRELPLRADYVGKNVPTSRAEDVSVLLTEHDGRDAVVLHSAAATAEDDA